MRLQITVSFIILLVFNGFAQQVGDFRSAQSGNFENVNIWEEYDGSAWIPALSTPFVALPDNLLIAAGHEVELNNNYISDQTDFLVEGIFDPNGWNMSLNSINYSGAISDDIGDLTLKSGASQLPEIKVENLSVMSEATLVCDGDLDAKNIFFYGAITMKPNTVLKLNEAKFYTNHALLLESQSENDAVSFFPQSVWYDGDLDSVITIQRVMEGYAGDPNFNPWHTVSVPVDNAVSGNFVDFYLKYFDEINTGQFEQVDPTSTLTVPLPPMVGYISMYADPGFRTIEFEGRPNMDESYTANLTANTSGFNMVGNPYSCSIDIIQIVAGGGVVPRPISNIVWVWDSEAGNYITRDINGDVPPNDVLAPCQAFFCKAYENTTVTIPALARIDTHLEFLKEQEVSPDCISLKVSESSGRSDEVWIAIRDGSTDGFDANFDADKITGQAGAPQFYSFIGDKRASVDVRPSSNELIFDFGFEKSTEGDEYTLAAGNLEGVSSEKEVLLVDHKLDITQDLSDNPSYTFTSDEDDMFERFSVKIATTAVPVYVDNSRYDIFMDGSNLHIKGEDTSNGDLFIYNMVGQCVYTQSWSSDQNVIALQLNTGCYIVKLRGADFSCSSKILVD